ncbi:hypothetical protein ACQ4PT_035861 [Festuca glaucescens]
MARSEQQGLPVLSALDAAKTQWYHFTAIVVAGMGFFTDAYDLFCISLVTKLLGRIYYTDLSLPNPGTLPPSVAAAVNGVAFCGTLSGQLFFGWLGNKLGRKSVYGMTLMVMTRGAFIAAVFAMQGFGILAGGIVTLIISAAFRAGFPEPANQDNAAASTGPEADFVWRIILMIGAVPALLTYYWRMKMPETARYTALVSKDAKLAAADMSKVLQVELEDESKKMEEMVSRGNDFGLFSPQFARRHGLHLVGTATTWFLLDIAFYSQNLFQKDIFTAINWIPKARTMSGLDEVFRISRAQTLLALCGTVPGYWFTVFLIDVVGRFKIQLMGFFMMTVFMLGLAVPYPPLDDARQPGRLRGHVRLHLLLRQLRAQRNHIRRAGGDLPGEASVDVPRDISRLREGRSHHRGLRVPLRRAGPAQAGRRVQGRDRHP